MREHLVASLRAGGDDGGGGEPLGELGDRARPGERSVRPRDVGDVEDVHGGLGRPGDGDGVHGAVHAPGGGERLQRQLVAWLDENEDGHAIPSSRSSSTTAGAACGPCPRIRALVPFPSGTTRRSLTRRGSGRAGVEVAIGLR